MNKHKAAIPQPGRTVATLRPKAVALAVAACFSGAALANPVNPTVVHGTATFQQAGNILNITNSANAIINWGSFSINVGELTRFIQPSALSAVLNRVTGQDPSAILGALQSNGRVFLVNPNGIVFGAGAQIDVAGLVASTLNLSNEDFLNNRMRFTDGAGAGSIVNQGQITGGSVYLVGKAVTNDGLITSPNGEVVLAAGNSVELVNPGTPNLRVEITAPDNEARNLGTISAEAGRIGIYAGLIQQSGTLRADSAVVEGGRIVLKATKNVHLASASQTSASGISGGTVDIQAGDTVTVEGDIAATGSDGAGGKVQVLGNLVGLTGHANIDASGDTQGGTVLVGGDYQGKNPDVQNAFRTYVGPDVTINADAITEGDGGEVIVWADDATRFQGNISARGGASGGGGGFAEVSGKRYLDYRGVVDLGATNGATGTLLLDPDNIVISSAGVNTSDTTIDFGDPGATSIIAPSTLNAAIADIVLQANEDITVSEAIMLANSGIDVTLQAGAHLYVNASITTLGGEITLVAGDPGSLTSPSEGGLFVNAGLDTTGAGSVATGADIRLTTHLSDVGGNSLQINAPVNAGTAGNVIILDTNGSIEQGVSGAITAHGLAASASNGNVELNVANNQVDHFAAFAGNAVVDTDRQVLFKNTRNLSLETVDTVSGIKASASASYGGSVSLDLGGNHLIGATGQVIIVEGDSTSSITVTNAASIGESGGQFLEVNPGAGTVSLTSTTGGIGVKQVAGNLLTSRYTLASPAGQKIALASAGGSLQANGSLSLTGVNLELITEGANDIVFDAGAAGTVTAASVKLAPNSGRSALLNSGVSPWTFNAPVTVLNGAAVSVGSGMTVNFGSLAGHTFDATGQLSVASGGTANFAGAANIGQVSNAGTVGNTGTLTIGNTLNWSAGGTFSGSGLLSTPGGVTSNVTGSGNAVLAPGKTWNNAGTVNIGGAATVDLGDATAAIFNNQSGGVVNINSTAGWSFISDSSSQVGQINNAGTINVQNGTSWEAAFSNAAGGVLNIAAGNALSMQNGKTINGTVNIGAGGTLWVSERHGSDTIFSGTTIGGSGILQVLGSSPVARFTNVNASGATLKLGSGGTAYIQDGTSTFGALDAAAYGGGLHLNNGTLALATGNLTAPAGANYSGNVGYWAKGGDVIVNTAMNAYGGSISLEASGNVKVLGGGDVSAGTVKLKGANVLIGDSAATSAASVYASSQLDVVAGGLTLQGGSGANASALVSSSGALNVSASGDVVLTGGSGADAWAKLSGNPDVVLASVGGAVRMSAGTGTNAYAIIESVSPTTIYVTFPNAGSGGYFVNGTGGVVYDAATHTGFVAGGNPAVLGSNLVVTYGGSSTTVPSGSLELPVQTLIVATGESQEPPDAEKDKDVFEDIEEKKKKEAPVCR